MKNQLSYQQFCYAIYEDSSDRMRQDKINLLRRKIGELRQKRNCEKDTTKKRKLYYSIKICELKISLLQVR